MEINHFLQFNLKIHKFKKRFRLFFFIIKKLFATMHKSNEGHAELLPKQGKSNLIQLVHIVPTLPKVDEESRSHCATLMKGMCKQAFTVAGNNVVPTPPRQSSQNIDELYQKADEACGEFRALLADLTRKSNALNFITPEDIRKKRASAHRKANNDYSGDASRVCDILRSTIYTAAPEQIRKLANMLRPANNAAVVRYEDSFSQPDEDGALRRLMVNIRLSNGLIVEIQVRLKSMEPAYQETSTLYIKARATKARLEAEKDNLPQDTLLSLQKQHDRFMAHREEIHREAARHPILRALISETNFYLVNGVPVMHEYDRFADEHSTVVANPQTGKFVTDNSFLPLLGEDSGHEVKKIGKDTFVRESVVLVSRNEEVKRHLQLIA